MVTGTGEGLLTNVIMDGIPVVLVCVVVHRENAKQKYKKCGKRQEQITLPD